MRAKEIDDCSTKVGLHVCVEVVFFTFGLVEKYEGIRGAIFGHGKAILFTLHITHMRTIPTSQLLYLLTNTICTFGHGSLLTISPSLQFCTLYISVAMHETTYM